MCNMAGPLHKIYCRVFSYARVIIEFHIPWFTEVLSVLIPVQCSQLPIVYFGSILLYKNSQGFPTINTYNVFFLNNYIV